MFTFGLGNTMKVEERKVQSFPVLFGDLIGLKEFFSFFVGLLLPRYTDWMKAISQVDSIYRMPG